MRSVRQKGSLLGEANMHAFERAVDCVDQRLDLGRRIIDRKKGVSSTCRFSTRAASV